MRFRKFLKPYKTRGSSFREHTTAYWRGKGNGQSTKALITINADTSVYCKEVSNEF